MTVSVFNAYQSSALNTSQGQFAGLSQIRQHDYSLNEPFTFGRDKTGLLNNAMIVYNLSGAIASGEIIANAALRCTAGAVDTGALTVDVCMLPVDGAHKLDQDLSPPVSANNLLSGESAWWQAAVNEFGKVGVVRGPRRPSLRMRIRDTGASDLFSFNYTTTATIGATLHRFIVSDMRQYGEQFRAETTGTLGDATMRIGRVGLPGGTSFYELYSGTYPNLTLIATSNVVLTNSLTQSGADVTLGFPAGQRPLIVSGTDLVLAHNVSAAPQYPIGGAVFFADKLPGAGSTSDGPVSFAGFAGLLAGPRYILRVDLPHLYDLDGATAFDAPFGSISRLSVPAFASVGAAYDIQSAHPQLQEWVHSVEFTRKLADVIGFQIAIPSDVNTVNDRERVASHIQLVVEHRPAQTYVFMPRSF